MNQIIKIKRSTVPNAVPSALAEGELGINLADVPIRMWVGTASGVKELFAGTAVEDAPDDAVYGRCNGEWVQQPVVLNEPPADPAPNTLWWDDADGVLYIWYDNGTNKQWVAASPALTGQQGPVGATGPQGPVGATGPEGPIGGADQYLPLTGGTLTGSLTLAANAAAAMQAVPLQQLQQGYLPLSGGTLTGMLMINTGATSNVSLIMTSSMSVAGHTQLTGNVNIGGHVYVDTTATVMGALTLGGNATQPLQAVPLRQLQQYLPLTGGTITGPLTVVGHDLIVQNGSFAADNVYAHYSLVAGDATTLNMTPNGNLPSGWGYIKNGHSAKLEFSTRDHYILLGMYPVGTAGANVPGITNGFWFGHAGSFEATDIVADQVLAINTTRSQDTNDRADWHYREYRWPYSAAKFTIPESSWLGLTVYPDGLAPAPLPTKDPGFWFGADGEFDAAGGIWAGGNGICTTLGGWNDFAFHWSGETIWAVVDGIAWKQISDCLPLVGGTLTGPLWVNDLTGIWTAGNINANGAVSASQTITAGQTIVAGGNVQAGHLGLVTTLGGTNAYAFHYPGAANLYVNVDNTGWQLLAMASDERLKQDIEPSAFDCLTTVERLPLHRFRWKKGTDEVPIGLVAQRVAEIEPSLVDNPPPPHPSAQPRDGVAPFSPRSINVNNTLAVLIGAVQQLVDRVKALEESHARLS